MKFNLPARGGLLQDTKYTCRHSTPLWHAHGSTLIEYFLLFYPSLFIALRIEETVLEISSILETSSELAGGILASCLFS